MNRPKPTKNLDQQLDAHLANLRPQTMGWDKIKTHTPRHRADVPVDAPTTANPYPDQPPGRHAANHNLPR